jgi:hypothetical protein
VRTRRYGFTGEPACAGTADRELDFILGYETRLRQGFGGQVSYRLGLSADRQAATRKAKRIELVSQSRFGLDPQTTGD